MENILIAFAHDIRQLQVAFMVLVALLLGIGIGKKF